MNTIKTKLILLFGLFMLALIACGILLNVLFLEKYYILKNNAILSETSDRITAAYGADKGMISVMIGTIDRSEGINCTIADKNRVVSHVSFPQTNGPDAKRLPKEIDDLISRSQRDLARSSLYQVVVKSADQTSKLVFISQLPDGGFLILKKEMKGIQESVLIANRFYLIAGLLMILIGSVFIFIFSNKVTRPIVEMSHVTEALSNLDFDKRVYVASHDELGRLGESINNISEKLNISLNALKLDVARRKQLVRNISHELKTPIGVIKGYAEGLRFGVADDREKRQKYCVVLSDECDRMDRMVRELLNLSWMESETFQVRKSLIDVRRLIFTILDRFEQVFSEQGIRYACSCPDGLAVSADSELIERALNNYITNAIHYCEGEKLIRFDVTSVASGIRISVVNSGNPIPEPELAHIWDVFYKVDKARTREYGGHGLGLSIVKLIMELHGGTVGVENRPDGVSFYIELSV